MKTLKDWFAKFVSYIKKNKVVCIVAVILVVAALVGISRLQIETPTQHASRQNEQSDKRKELLAQLEQEEVAKKAEESSCVSADAVSGDGIQLAATGSSVQEEAATQAALDLSADASEGTTTQLVTDCPSASVTENGQAEASDQQTIQQNQNSSQNTIQGQKPSQTTTQVPAGATASPQTPTDKVQTQAPTSAPASTKQPEQEYIVVSVKIVCDNVLNHPDLSTSADIPSNGCILDCKTVIKKGQTVLDALQAACSDNGKNVSYKGTAQGAYVTAIAGLSEKECGRYSGWKYTVNGVVSGKSCGALELKENDEVLWYYATTYTQ